MTALSPEGVEWSGENAALGLPRAWTVPWKQGERREGDRLPLLLRVLVREGTRGWQLCKPAAANPEPGSARGPAGQSLGFLMGPRGGI